MTTRSTRQSSSIKGPRIEHRIDGLQRYLVHCPTISFKRKPLAPDN